MPPAADLNATPELDSAHRLPPAHQRSYVAMLAVQAMNAFNDNFVKILLVAFAGVVAKGTDIGGSMQLYLGAIFSLPYVLFAPLAGWLSDRWSKQRVIFWMQVLQVLIFLCFLGAQKIHEPIPTLWVSLGCFFLLATQAAFFSPAKYGIMKELVGSRRLGSASGTMQLTNFVGILGGMGIAGAWFAARLKGGDDAWGALWFPMVVVTVLAVAQIFGALLIQKTPEHPTVRFHKGVWFEHFAHLKLLFAQRPIKLAALGVTFFWFMSNAIGGILVTLAHEMHATDDAAAARALSMMPAMLGVGIMFGSVLAGLLCRKRIELGLVPLSGYALAASLLWSGLAPVSPWIYAALIGVGLSAGVFMTPLYAFVQDRAKPEERARILSAMNLMDCVGGIVANIVLVKAMLYFKMPSWAQLLVLVPLTLAAALFITRLLPRPLLTLVVNLIMRTLYRIKVHHLERMPREGAVLLLPNHVSYADALVFGVASDRMARFVLLDSLYKMKSVQWFYKLFGTVPISATKAKEAIRTVGAALKEGEAIVLFAEGQLTRTGFLNEINKGYQLMARMGGEVVVQPVWLDGLWGSIFSFEGGRFFKKVPKAYPYRVGVWFGEPMPSTMATPDKVREALLALSTEAFLSRDPVRKVPRLALPDGTALDHDAAQVAHVNAMRLLETSLLREDDIILCVLPPSHPVARSFGIALPEQRNVTVCWSHEQLDDKLKKRGASSLRIILVGDAATLAAPNLQRAETACAVTVQAISTDGSASAAAAFAANAHPAVYDEATGVLLTLSVPDPELPEDEQGAQVGRKPGSLGHLLPGLTVQGESGGLLFNGLLPDKDTTARLRGVKLDEDGFVMPIVATIPVG